MKSFKKLLALVLCLTMTVTLFVCLGSLSASAATQSFDKTVTLEQMKTTANMKRGSHIFDNVTYSNGVLNVPVPNSEHKQLTLGSASINAYLSAIPASTKPQQSSSGYTRAIWIKYKVKSIGTGGYAQVGIGYTATYDGSWSATNIVGVDKKITEAGDTEYSFAASIPYNGNQEYRFVFSGVGDVEYEITSVKWASKQSLKYAVVRYHIGDDFMYPVFCNNQAQKKSEFSSLGAPKDTVSTWYDANGTALSGNFITPGSNLTNSADIDVYDTIAQKTIVNQDFESSTTLSDLHIDANDVNKGNAWTVAEDGDGKYLQRTATNNIGDKYYTWGFRFSNATIVAGRTYKVSFKAKSSENDTTLDFAILTGSRYFSHNADSEIFDADHTKVTLSNDDWTEVEAYFTGKSFSGGSNPVFQILNTGIGTTTVLSFDDFVIQEVYGMSFNEYGNKYATPNIVELDGDYAILPGDPEREGYVFDGWYVGNTLVTEETEVSNFMSAAAKWVEATTTKDDIDDITESGIYDLGIKVTNANAYPVKFALNTSGEVTVSVFTASADDSDTAKSVAWKRTFNRGGNVVALIEPATVKVDGVTGNELWVSLEYEDSTTAAVTDFVIGNAPASRKVEGDVNADNSFDLLDLVNLKKMAAGTVAVSWLGDIDGNDFAVEAEDLVSLKKKLLGVSNIVTEKDGRTLVWNEEFDGDALDTAKFGYSWYTNRNNSTTPANLNVTDGKLNLNVTKLNGLDFATAPRIVTDGKMSYKYGYLEVRAKMSCTPNQWASIWLGDKDSTGNHGEIDIVETNQEGTTFKPNVHVWDNAGERIAQYEKQINAFNYDENNFNKTEYHTFGFEWDATSLKFYVDGVKYLELAVEDIYGTEISDSFPYDGILDEFYSVRLSQTFYEGLTYDDVMPEFNIDYVRLYQKAGEQLKINGTVQ